ncbi:hypothetical protein I4F81_010822 [Pyropia yezoensis]|uniref:Uncharacterized protein n=1 Tax=Pyropia yezoensis TaxID=2788 RepID=A0ACC3CEQ6_PYRYE|nr:hypothetical protein I4F81_010822 [Neopyropia yezoensis]
MAAAGDGRGDRNGGRPLAGGRRSLPGGGRAGGHLAASDAQVGLAAGAVDRGAVAAGDAAVDPAVDRDGRGGLASWVPNQLCLNRYEAGTGHAITPHNDNEGGGLRVAVAGVCIGAAAVMTFLHANGDKRDVALPGGCAYVMSGDAFAVWRHAIFASNIDYRRGGGGARVSLTLRQVEERQAHGGGGGTQPRAASLTGSAKRSVWPRVCGPMDAFTRPPSPGAEP